MAKASGRLHIRSRGADKLGVHRTARAMLPPATGLGRRQEALLVCGFGLLAVLLAAAAVNAAFGVGGHAVERVMRDWASTGAYVLVAGIVGLRAWRIESKRLPWALFAAGLSLYAVGNLLWTFWVHSM